MEELNIFLNLKDNQKDYILNNILSSNINIKNNIEITSNVFNDINIDDWINNLPSLNGSKILLNHIIKNPINDINILRERQETSIELSQTSIDLLKKYEENVLWIYTLNDEIDKDLSINLLYPSTYLINLLNNYNIFLEFYHPYKIFIIPFMSFVYPLTLFLTPYYYMNKYLKSKISIINYIKLLYSFLKFIFTKSGNIRRDLIKLITFLIYIAIYIYSIYQTFELSYIMYKTKNKLKEKMEGLCIFIKESINIIQSNNNKWQSFNIYDNDINFNENLLIKNNMADIYKIWKNDNIKKDISNILKIVYIIDIINSITILKNKKNWCCPKYISSLSSSSSTKLWNMKNPILNDNQSKNPVDLSKNIIITGPNAAGKTTYVKTITTNIILSQSIGIVNAIKADINIYDYIHSFMRISDVLGAKSYFEAETEYCSNMIKCAIKIKDKRGLFLMDEPMHSTPPIEGMSIAYAVIEYLSGFKNINTIITTHYHKLINLENKYPDRFINLYVYAIYNKELNKYLFNYKINKGYTTQCIAIELLEKQKFPKDVIDSAIIFKNILCKDNIANI